MRRRVAAVPEGPALHVRQCWTMVVGVPRGRPPNFRIQKAAPEAHPASKPPRTWKHVVPGLYPFAILRLAALLRHAVAFQAKLNLAVADNSIRTPRGAGRVRVNERTGSVPLIHSPLRLAVLVGLLRYHQSVRGSGSATQASAAGG